MLRWHPRWHAALRAAAELVMSAPSLTSAPRPQHPLPPDLQGAWGSAIPTRASGSVCGSVRGVCTWWGACVLGCTCTHAHAGSPSPRERLQRQGLCMWEAAPISPKPGCSPAPSGLGSCREPFGGLTPEVPPGSPILPRGTDSPTRQALLLREPPSVSFCLDAPWMGSSLLLTAPPTSLSPPRSGSSSADRLPQEGPSAGGPARSGAAPGHAVGLSGHQLCQLCQLSWAVLSGLQPGTQRLHRGHLPSHPLSSPSGLGGGSR